MCRIESFNQRTKSCRRNERRQPLLSTGLACSATLRARAGARFRGTLLYAGSVEATINLRVPATGEYFIYIVVRFPISQLPAGTYGCRFQTGRRALAGSVRSAGPPGPLVGTAVCPTSTIAMPGMAGCDRDYAATPLPAGPLTCSTLIAARKGHQAAVELVSTTTPEQPTVLSRFEGTVPLPLTEAFLNYSAPVQPGTYACRFYLDGQLVAEKPFSVA